MMFDLDGTHNKSVNVDNIIAAYSSRSRSIRHSIAPSCKVSKSVVGNRDLFRKFQIKDPAASSNQSDELRFANL